jgi:hypothetical protein
MKIVATIFLPGLRIVSLHIFYNEFVVLPNLSVRSHLQAFFQMAGHDNTFSLQVKRLYVFLNALKYYFTDRQVCANTSHTN